MNKLFIGNTIVRLPIVASTNEFAAQLLKTSSPLDGTVIIADTQLKGKGQIGNTWISEPFKNLTLSIILFPKNMQAERQFKLTQIVSLAIVDFIEQKLSPENIVSIKWPNDIFVNDKKIAGVLIENSLRGNEISSSVIGIGININQENFGVINERTTSLKKCEHKDFDLQICLDDLCTAIEARYMQFLNKNNSVIESEYLQKLFQLNERKKYEVNEKIVEAKIIGVNKEGKLLLESIDNTAIVEYDLKEIKFLL